MISHPLMRVPRIPFICIWEITRACNLRCIHCENFGGTKGKQELSFEEMLTVVKSLKQLGCKVVDITGGEPLMHPKWHELAKCLSDSNIRCALITNGLSFNEHALRAALDAGVETVAFSLDGPEPIHDMIRKLPSRFSLTKSPYEITVNNLKLANEHIKTTVITQINRLNLPHLEELYSLLNKLKIQKWQLQLTVPTGRVLRNKPSLIITPEQLNELTSFIVDKQNQGDIPFIDTSDTVGYYTDKEKILRKRTGGQGLWLGCQAGIRAVAITFNGKVRGCSMLPPEFNAGDLHTESLEDIWKDASRFGYSTAFDPNNLEGDCKSCSYGAICRAGCTSMAYYTTGTIYSNPYCISRPSVRKNDTGLCEMKRQGTIQ